MNGRLKRNLLPDATMLDALSKRNDFAGRLVSQYLRIRGAAGADTAFKIPVHIRPANADGPQPDRDFARSGVRRLWDFPFFKSSWSY